MQDEFLSYYTISLTISLTKKLLQKKKFLYGILRTNIIFANRNENKTKKI